MYDLSVWKIGIFGLFTNSTILCNRFFSLIMCTYPSTTHKVKSMAGCNHSDFSIFSYLHLPVLITVLPHVSRKTGGVCLHVGYNADVSRYIRFFSLFLLFEEHVCCPLSHRIPPEEQCHHPFTTELFPTCGS